MNINHLDNKKTALLFFDMLNVYYHGASDETKKRMKPVVDNAVRLMNAARKHGILDLLCHGQSSSGWREQKYDYHRNRYALRPWPNDDCNPTVHGATEGSWEQKVIEEIAPRPGGLRHSQIPLEHVSSNLFRSGAALARHRYADRFRRRRRRRRRLDGLCGARFGLQHHRRPRRLQQLP